MTGSAVKRGNVRAAALCVFAVTMLWLGVAHGQANRINQLIADLNNSSDRVRISAVLALTNQQAPQAIPALAKKLLDRSEQKNIRGLAATALGRTVMNGKPSASQRRTAIDALTKAKGDPDPFVSSKSDAALGQLGGSSPGRGGGGSSGGLFSGAYVNIGPMSSKTGTPNDKKYKALMDKTAKNTMSRVAPKYKTTWSGGRTPTKADLQKVNFGGFYVFGTLNEMKITQRGGSARVSCKVSMVLADFPDRNAFGFLNGGAAVETSASDAPLAQQDCVAAVVEDLIAKKIVPTIKSKVRP